MSHPFSCLKTEEHLFKFKSNKGHVCRNCGIISTTNSPQAYKSSRYAGKIHFHVNHYEDVLQEQVEGYKISSLEYLRNRPQLIRFILEKGKSLKISQKTLHIGIHFMDLYFEKNQRNIKNSENHLVAACSMLLGAKSGELDERIPFIGKLKKYTSLYMSRDEFKRMEVALARGLDWDLQRITFFSFIEYFLSSGVVVADDRVSKSFLNSLSMNGIDDTVRMLVKEESSSQRGVNIEKSANPEKVDEGAYESYKSNRQNYSDVGSLNYGLRNDLVKTFEFYVKDLCNLIVEEFKFWEFDKKVLATSIVLYARSAVFDPSCTWNLRLKDLTGLELKNIRDVYGKICKFVTGSKLNLNSPHKQMGFSASKSKNTLQVSKSITNNSSNKMTSYGSQAKFSKNGSGVKIVMGQKKFGQEQNVNILSSRKNILSSRRKISSNVSAINRVDTENKPV